MKKETIIIHTADYESISDLEDEQLGKLFRSLLLSQRGEAVPKMDKQTKMAYNFMVAQIERDNEKYNSIVEKRRAAAQKRWNKGDNMQMHDLHSHSVSDSDSVSDSVSDSDRDKSLWAALPPLSPGDEALLRRNTGDERADALIGDVRNYYTAHPEKRFPGWPIALAQFDANQKRWGTANKPRQKTDAEIIAEMEKEGMFE